MPARWWTWAAPFLAGFSTGLVGPAEAAPPQGSCQHTQRVCDGTDVSLLQRRLAVERTIGRSGRAVEDGILYNGTVDIKSLSRDIPRSFVYVHIPKTGGTTLMVASPGLLPNGSTLQGNFEKAARELGLNDTKRKPLTFFRSPMTHVLSQFLECKYDYWGKVVTNSTDFPRRDMNDTYGGFDIWLQHFVNADPTKAVVDVNTRRDVIEDFGCYCPWNMQTRYMTSAQVGDGHHCWRQADALPDLETAKRNVDKMFFVGILELYPETLCTFMYFSTGSVPDDCACGARFDVHSGKIDVREHGLPHHSVSNLSASTQATILKLTKIDVELWAYSVRKFLATARHVQDQTGVKIFCGSRAAGVKSMVHELLRRTGSDKDESWTA